MDNKRRCKRVPISASAAVIIKKSDKVEAVLAMTANISLSGIGLYVDRHLEPETDVSLSIKFISMDGAIRTDSIEGSIVYTKDMGGIYFMGVQFDDEINPKDQPFLHSHLMQILTTD